MSGDPADPSSEESTLDSASSASLGSMDRYRLLQRLGQGGMGEVWLAEQTDPVRRQVALKVIKAGMDSAQVVARFEVERQALALMDHPAIAMVFDGGTTPQGRPYFAMEYVRGEPITVYCDRHRLTMRQRLELFALVCDGVQHAHQKGIIHRDLKPTNVLVAIQDDRPVPKIIDFGVAKATSLQLTERSLFTELGVLIGTPEYMSPEQAEMGGLDIDTRTDIYALGVLLYELLAGALPFDRNELRQGSLSEIQRIIREVDPARPSARVTQLSASAGIPKSRQAESRRLASELRGDLDWITMRALEKDRTRRYQTANGLAMDVRRYLGNEPVSAGPPSAVYRARKFVRRHRFGVSAAVVLLSILGLFAGAMAVQVKRTAHERDRANREAEAAKQVSDFLVGLFEVSDPGESRGKTLTAAEILSTGAEQVKDRLRTQPEIQARLMTTIGDVYLKLGMFSEGERVLKDAVETYTLVKGPDDPERLRSLNLFADSHWYLSRFDVAEPLYLELVERTERTLGKEHRSTLKAKFDLASLFAQQKRYSEAERLTFEVLRQQERVLGDSDPETAASRGVLQGLYYRQKRYAEALPFAQKAWDADRKALGEDHPKTLMDAHNVATILEGLGRHDEAEALFLSTINARRRVLGELHPNTCATLRELGRLYVAKARYREAEPLLLAAYDVYSRTFGLEHSGVRDVTSLLTELYQGWGKQEKAVAWRAKLTALASADDTTRKQ